MVALVGLRHGTCAASLGADDDLRYLARRIRERFPDVEIIVRGDSAFGVPLMYDVCEELRLTHTFGLSMNPRLKAASAELLAQAEKQFEETGVKQRLFLPLMYQADSWDQPRQVVISITRRAAQTPTSPFQHLWGGGTSARTPTSRTSHTSPPTPHTKKSHTRRCMNNAG